MANCTAHDFPEDVTAAFVRRKNAVRDEEGCCADVVGNYTQRRRTVLLVLASLSFPQILTPHPPDSTRPPREPRAAPRVPLPETASDHAAPPSEPHPLLA